MKRVLSAVGRQLVLDTFAKQTLAIEMGATIRRIEAGEVEVHLPKHALAVQHHGYFHGGVISYLGDISGGLAGISLLNHPGMNCITVELKINFMKPGKGDFLVGKGKVIQEGGSLIVAQAEIFSGDELVAFLVQTNKKLKEKKE